MPIDPIYNAGPAENESSIIVSWNVSVNAKKKVSMKSKIKGFCRRSKDENNAMKPEFDEDLQLNVPLKTAADGSTIILNNGRLE